MKHFLKLFVVALPFWYFAIVYPVQNLTGTTPTVPEIKQFGPFGNAQQCNSVQESIQTLYAPREKSLGMAGVGCWDANATPIPAGS